MTNEKLILKLPVAVFRLMTHPSVKDKKIINSFSITIDRG